jgi:predicted small secreted protein
MFKMFVSFALCFTVVGCGTLGGAVSGAGEDLQKAGNWIRSK